MRVGRAALELGRVTIEERSEVVIVAPRELEPILREGARSRREFDLLIRKKVSGPNVLVPRRQLCGRGITSHLRLGRNRAESLQDRMDEEREGSRPLLAIHQLEHVALP